MAVAPDRGGSDLPRQVRGIRERVSAVAEFPLSAGRAVEADLGRLAHVAHIATSAASQHPAPRVTFPHAGPAGRPWLCCPGAPLFSHPTAVLLLLGSSLSSEGDAMPVKLGVLALLEAKPGKGDDLAAFLQAGRNLAAAEE